MKEIFKRTILGINGIICCLGICLGGLSAHAEEGSSTLMVSPPNQSIILIPGESYDGSIKVSNPNDAKQNLEYSVSIGPFSQKKTDDSNDDYGEVDAETITAYNQIMDWIVLESDSGSVEPNSTKTVNFTINVPDDAPAGGQYATIVVKDDTDYLGESTGNVSVKSTTSVASIIYAEVAGETKENGAISENFIPSFLLSSPLEATSMVQNNGNIHTNAKYTLQVWPLGSSEEICTNEEAPEESLVMPETQKYHTQTCDLPSVGIFNAKQTVTIFGETSVVEKMIIVCPIWLLFIIFFVIAAIIIWIVMRVRGRKKSGARKAKAVEAE